MTLNLTCCCRCVCVCVPGATSGEQSTCQCRLDVRDTGSVPGLGRFPGGGHGNSFHYSCLENPMGKGSWQAVVHRVAQSQAQLKWHSTYTDTHTHNFSDITHTQHTHTVSQVALVVKNPPASEGDVTDMSTKLRPTYLLLIKDSYTAKGW